MLDCIGGFGTRMRLNLHSVLQVIAVLELAPVHHMITVRVIEQVSCVVHVRTVSLSRF